MLYGVAKWIGGRAVKEHSEHAESKNQVQTQTHRNRRLRPSAQHSFGDWDLRGSQ